MAAERTFSSGCRRIMAGNAPVYWVADKVWLRSHMLMGLQADIGCRERTNIVGCNLTLAAGFARYYWVADTAWLPERTGTVECISFLAAGGLCGRVRISSKGLYSGLSSGKSPRVLAVT